MLLGCSVVTIWHMRCVRRVEYALAQDTAWAAWAASELRDLAATLFLNDRCSEELPGQQSVGGTRKSSSSGAKVLHHFLCSFIRHNISFSAFSLH